MPKLNLKTLISSFFSGSGVVVISRSGAPFPVANRYTPEEMNELLTEEAICHVQHLTES